MPLLSGHQCKGGLLHWYSVMCGRHWGQVPAELKAELSAAKGTEARTEITARMVMAIAAARR